MNMQSFYKRKVNISEEVQESATQFIEKIKNNDIKIDVLPNTYENFTGKLEIDDYLSFCLFIESRKGMEIMRLLEE